MLYTRIFLELYQAARSLSASGLGFRRLFSFRKRSHIINKLEDPEKAFVTLTPELGVCPAALTFHGVSESVGPGKVVVQGSLPGG